MSTTTEFTADESKALRDKNSIVHLICLPAAATGIWCLAIRWPADNWLVYSFWTLFTAYFLFCWTSCFHETAHQTLCQSRTVSIWLGRFLGTAMFTPYTIYRESHIRHHAYLNKPTDWELWPYSDPNASLTFRRCFVWVDLIAGMFTSPAIYCRLFFHKDSPLQNPKMRRTIRYEFAGIVLVWGTIIALLTYYSAWPAFFRVWGIPHFIAGIFQSSRKLTEHLGMSSYDPMLGTRTVLGSTWVTKFCTFANFDIFIHGPHHRHPRLAHNALGDQMEKYIDENPDVKFPRYNTYLSATWDMLPAMIKSPGVGMNVGAAPPQIAKNEGVNDFVADVTTDVLADEDAEVTSV
ncbi:fatty acid desaturase [Symmachiella dynata]|uniref:fatty acid desaturase family protein n=1 Tax=Symmachiella dynata TaxID=2527995 RepID=UPI0030EC919C